MKKIFLALLFILLSQSLQARYYDPDMGRFASRDPIGYSDGMNLYAGYFAQSFDLDPSGTKSRIVKHDLKIITKWGDVTEVKKLRRNDESTRGQTAVEAHYNMSVISSRKGCPVNCKKIILLDNKWDDVDIYGFVLEKYKDSTGDPENRPNRTRTTSQHEQKHMDYAELYYKNREAIIIKWVTGRCEPDKKADERRNKIQEAFDKAFAGWRLLNEMLEVEDYKNDRTKLDKLRKDYEQYK